MSILFIQGAGHGAHEEDRHLAESLRHALGSRFDVRYPAMPAEEDAPYDQWCETIERDVADAPGPVMIVGHSVGASILIKWFCESAETAAVAGVFLVACPFWGGDGWLYEGYEKLALQPGCAANLPPGVPVFLYHCQDDPIVPFDHLALYSQALPQATVRAHANGGHQLNNDLTAVARDIDSLCPN